MSLTSSGVAHTMEKAFHEKSPKEVDSAPHEAKICGKNSPETWKTRKTTQNETLEYGKRSWDPPENDQPPPGTNGSTVLVSRVIGTSRSYICFGLATMAPKTFLLLKSTPPIFGIARTPTEYLVATVVRHLALMITRRFGVSLHLPTRLLNLRKMALPLDRCRTTNFLLLKRLLVTCPRKKIDTLMLVADVRNVSPRVITLRFGVTLNVWTLLGKSDVNVTSLALFRVAQWPTNTSLLEKV